MLLGIDVGGTNIKWGIFKDDFTLINNYSKPTKSELGPEKIIQTIANIINLERVKHVGIGFPSVVSESGFVHIAPNIPNFININLLSELLKLTDAKISIDNDANVAAIAEQQIGSAKEEENFLYVTLGTGVGGAIYLNGNLIKGANSGAGEIGYTTINYNEKRESTRPNRRGILEDYCGLPRLKERYFELTGTQNINLQKLSKLADVGDKTATELFQYFGEKLGYGIASVLNLLDIDIVVIGGGLSHSTQIMYTKLKETIQSRLLEHKISKLEIRKAKFLNDAGIFGAACLAKSNK